MKLKPNRLTDGSVVSLGAALAVGLGLSVAWAPWAQAAGTVQVLVDRGVLIIEGDSQPNCIELIGEGGDQEHRVSDCDGSTVIRCKVQQAQCIEDANLGPDNVDVKGVKNDIRFTTFGGDDEVTLDNGDNSTVRDDLEIDTGAGNDTVTVRQFAILDDMDIVTGSQNDLVIIDGVAVHDKTEIDTGLGRDCTVYGFPPQVPPVDATNCPTSP